MENISRTVNLYQTGEDVLQELCNGVRSSYTNSVEGDIAEFGTFTGSTAKILAWSLAKCDVIFKDNFFATGSAKKKLHLFDSFVGLPNIDSGPDTTAPIVVSGLWHPGQCKLLGEVELRNLIAEELGPDRFSIFNGWYKDTVPAIPRGTKYSLVHIDCDLYSSTIDVLDGLFSIEAVAEGCKIFFDDFDCNRASPNHGERRAWRECISKYSIDYSDSGSYGDSSHKFIVHSYSIPSQRLG